MLARRSGKRSGAVKRRTTRGFGSSKSEIPTVQEFVSKRDFTGALAVLDFKRRSGESDADTLEWIGYCAWHSGDFERALETFDELVTASPQPRYHVLRATCLFYLNRLDEAKDAAQQGDGSKLQLRLLFHLAQRQADEETLVSYHAQLEDVKLDQLSLAAVHYQRSHYQEATDVYKGILLNNREDMAINVYVAMCYYKVRGLEGAGCFDCHCSSPLRLRFTCNSNHSILSYVCSWTTTMSPWKFLAYICRSTAILSLP
jgi:intraflagellar transport protein 56